MKFLNYAFQIVFAIIVVVYFTARNIVAIAVTWTFASAAYFYISVKHSVFVLTLLMFLLNPYTNVSISIFAVKTGVVSFYIAVVYNIIIMTLCSFALSFKQKHGNLVNKFHATESGTKDYIRISYVCTTIYYYIGFGPKETRKEQDKMLSYIEEGFSHINWEE